MAVSLHDGSPARRRSLYRMGDAGLYRDLVRLAAASAPGPVSLDHVKEVLATAEELPALRFPIAGRDALALGAKPGRHVGEALRDVEAWWMGQDFRPGREACLEELKTRLEGA